MAEVCACASDWRRHCTGLLMLGASICWTEEPYEEESRQCRAAELQMLAYWMASPGNQTACHNLTVSDDRLSRQDGHGPVCSAKFCALRNASMPTHLWYWHVYCTLPEAQGMSGVTPAAGQPRRG